jgi:hypothetical protein
MLSIYKSKYKVYLKPDRINVNSAMLWMGNPVLRTTRKFQDQMRYWCGKNGRGLNRIVASAFSGPTMSGRARNHLLCILWQDLAFGEVEEAFLVRSYLMEVDMGVPGIDVILDLLMQLVSIRSADN